jgi:hypothetical protein
VRALTAARAAAAAVALAGSLAAPFSIAPARAEPLPGCSSGFPPSLLLQNAQICIQVQGSYPYVSSVAVGFAVRDASHWVQGTGRVYDSRHLITGDTTPQVRITGNLSETMRWWVFAVHRRLPLCDELFASFTVTAAKGTRTGAYGPEAAWNEPRNGQCGNHLQGVSP